MHKSLSLYLDLIRFLAAMAVFNVHANFGRFTGGIPGLWHLGGLGNDAVMVFFVLSGFVIAYVCDQKESTPRAYFISRFARLYSVVAPALILTFVLDSIGSRVTPEIYRGDWLQTDNPVWRFVANFFFVNELWFSSVKPFGNTPFWSLGYEFWYYVLFAAAYYVQTPRKWLYVAGISLLVGPKILILLPVWLLGVWAYDTVKRGTISPGLGPWLFFGSIAGYLLFRQLGTPQLLLDATAELLGKDLVHGKLGFSKEFLSSYVVGVLVALHFLGAAALAPRFAALLERTEAPIRYLAGYTFAIYLFHVPMLSFFAAMSAPVADPSLRGLITVVATIVGVWALGTITERRKGDLRRGLLRIYDAIATPPPTFRNR